MIDLSQPSSKYTPEQIAAMKKNAAEYLKRTAPVFSILSKQKETK